MILSLCLVWCAHPAHAETRRIALIHSFEPGYPPAAKALELLQKSSAFSAWTAMYANTIWTATATWRRQKPPYGRFRGRPLCLGSRVDSRARRPGCLCADGMQTSVAHEIPVVFSGVNYPNISLLLQYPNITGYADARLLAYHTHDESIMGKVAHLPDERTSVSGPQDMACVE